MALQARIMSIWKSSLLCFHNVYDGLYLVMQLAGIIAKGPLLDAYFRKESRFAPLLATYPLYLVKDIGLGIRGCIAYASQLSAPQEQA